MASPTLTLKLSDKTLKKLRALAMLSGSTVDQLEKEFADYFDQMLSENIAHILSELDGREVSLGDGPSAETRFSTPVSVKHDQDDNSEQAEEEAIGTAPQHDLSEDDLPEEVKSTAEVVEDEIQPPQFSAPNAGGNADAFLDAAMASEQQPSQAPAAQMVNIGGVSGQLRPAGKGFHPQRPRASVAEFTGDN